MMKDILDEAKELFKDAEEALSKNHEAALDDIKFARLGEQWPEDIRSDRDRDLRPCLTINRLPTFIRQVVNDARINSPQIKVHPVDDYADPDTAEIINGLIRNIEKNTAEPAYDKALEDAVTCGLGFFRISMDYACDDAFEMDLMIERIANPLSVYFDPHSTAVDASDWMYCFVITNMSHAEFKTSYPNADLIDWEGDKSGWITENEIRVAEYWKREEIDTELLMLADGKVLNKEQYEKNYTLFSQIPIVKTRPSKSYKVTQYILTSQEVIEENEWPGTLIPIVPVFGDEIVCEDERHFHSLVRQAKDAQRNYNYWRTASTEKVALATKAPWVGPEGFAEADPNWGTANSENHPYLEYKGNIPPQQTPPSMADAGSITEAMNASDDLKDIMGLQDASLGKAGPETSGKAIMARAREGDVSTFHFIDNLSRGIKYAGKVLLELIPHVYSAPRVLRVLGFDGEADTVQVNQEFVVNNITKIHDLTVGKYDLVVSTGPSFTTQREEAATQMTEMLRNFPAAAPIIGDLVAKNLDWPGADEIAKRLKTLLPPEIQAMEKMEGLPPEAQAAIANSQQQITQLTQVIEQGKQLLQQKDEEIKLLELERKSKQDELSVKELDSQRKHQATMAKIESDAENVRFREKEENRRMLIDAAIEAFKEQAQYLEDQQQESINMVTQNFDGYAEVIRELSNKIDELSNQNKSISVMAPSGETYEGEVQDGQIQIIAPSGQVYTGNITEH